ncbi:MAG: hypothetical protein K9G67_15460 [Bacteroidales bacterium]|nr:hypothetical protein [Bacteroidales bacterium]MCF8344037.1 hypothetical protein [Bacteroidales bacterium]MCF8351586.1 hypothetical protein [Bacteroidales bacterium]MCF8377753.1 hypothetical protein [Bacteroidales bacterium]
MSTVNTSQNANLIIFVNSLIYFLLAYFFVILLNNLFSILLALPMGFDATLYFYGFDLTLKEGTVWTKENIFVIYLLGPSITLFSGIIFEFWYKKRRRHLSKRKLFLLWVYVISYTWFFGNLIVGSLFYFGIGVALGEMQASLFLKLLLALLSFIFLLYLGFRSQKNVVISANCYYHKISGLKIGGFFSRQIILPALAGMLFVALYRTPYLGAWGYYDSFVLFLVVLFAIGLLFRFGRLKSLMFKRRTDHFSFSLGPLVLLLAIVALLRIGLASGLPIHL